MKSLQFIIFEVPSGERQLPQAGQYCPAIDRIEVFLSIYIRVLSQSSGNHQISVGFEIEIDPPRLCSRLLAVRSQIAKEWVKDLDHLAKMETDRVFSSYWDNVKNNRSSAGFDREALWHLEYIQSRRAERSV